MSLHWIMTPLAQYGAAALALGASLFLFITIKRDIHSVRGLAKRSSEAAADDINRLAAQLTEIADKVQAAETAPASAPPNEGITLTKRAQAVRMHRRGESIATVAAALKTPRNEIELLLKVQSLMKLES